jgi:hypothetical protein
MVAGTEDMEGDMAEGIMGAGRGGEAGSMDGVMAGGECVGCAGLIRVVAGMIRLTAGMIAEMIVMFGGRRGGREVPGEGRRTG